MIRPRVTQNGQALPELVDARLTPDKKMLILFVRQGERHFRRHINMTRHDAGLFCYNSAFGTLHFVRGIKELPANGERPFIRTLRTTLGIFTARRELVEALVFLLWGQEVTLSEWPEPEAIHREEVQPFPRAA
ncbi:hypothetical protein DEIPH_ctg017orf0235 [Deinococcus phoenicis]|uniref:Uncharacterized protein n=1 Tax=Deinococcus phoenicis TaxID=1476583 RepID=A0A016QS87_9DEIO|nr:hypothetical protein [Deinococcus phoenicis]EYB68856.1 hypothetical protein DEIPH_ctg017orf0235 [Deinococcus phoenicis]